MTRKQGAIGQEEGAGATGPEHKERGARRLRWGSVDEGRFPAQFRALIDDFVKRCPPVAIGTSEKPAWAIRAGSYLYQIEQTGGAYHVFYHPFGGVRRTIGQINYRMNDAEAWIRAISIIREHVTCN